MEGVDDSLIADGLLEAHEQVLGTFDPADPLRVHWRTMWMMMVGCHHLLQKGARFCSSKPIDFDAVEEFAVELLRGLHPNESQWPEKLQWAAGHYVISAEHRLSNVMDRLTAVARADEQDIRSTGDLRTRCSNLSKQCDVCRKEILDFASRNILRDFGKAKKEKAPPLLLVHWRVNDLKHFGDRRYGVKIEKVNRKRRTDATPTEKRWKDARAALRDLLTLFIGLGRHVTRECISPPGGPASPPSS